MASLTGPNSQLARIEKEHEEVVKALAKIKEAERLAADIKNRIEYMVMFANSSIAKRDLKLYKQSKNEFNAFPSYLEVEKILLRNVFPHIKVNKQFPDDQAYKRFMTNEHIATSAKLFKEEVHLNLKEAHEL